MCGALFIFKSIYFLYSTNSKSEHFFVVKVNGKNKIILTLGVIEQLDVEVINSDNESKNQTFIHLLSQYKQEARRAVCLPVSHFFPMKWHWVKVSGCSCRGIISLLSSPDKTPASLWTCGSPGQGEGEGL